MSDQPGQQLGASGRFIGRRRELRLLEAAYRSERSELIPIYGRRRVGKSELILRFLSDRPSIYLLGKEATAGLQIREFLRAAATLLDEPLLASLATDSWKEALLQTSGRWHGPGKLVLVFDEFQWTAAASPELPSVLQDCWDRTWAPAGNVMVILCGSFIGFMERKVLGARSPLFGRRTAQLKLRPFAFHEAAAFHPGYSLIDQARAWFVCGGIPLYHRFFTPRRSVEMNLVQCFLDEYAPLHAESEFLLREELREVESYYSVLLAVASGHTAVKEIAQVSRVAERSLPYYLHQLEQLGYMSRRRPLKAGSGTRQVRWVLDDSLLRYWFRFVYRDLSLIRHRGARHAFNVRIKPELDAYWGICFERLCRAALPYLYAREGVDAGYSIGEYWDRNVQIDVVGLRDDGWTDLGECKWGTVRTLGGLAAELGDKAARYPNPTNATIGRRLFLRSKPGHAAPTGVAVHTLADLYAAANANRDG